MKKSKIILVITIIGVFFMSCGKSDKGTPILKNIDDSISHKEEHVSNQDDDFKEDRDDEEEHGELDTEYSEDIIDLSEIQINNYYNNGLGFYISEEYEEALDYFEQIQKYKDVDKYIKECKYQIANNALADGDYDLGYQIYQELDDYRNAKSKIVSADFLSKIRAKYPSGTKEKFINKFYGQWISESGELIDLTELNFLGKPYCYISAGNIQNPEIITKRFRIGEHYEMGYADNPSEVVFELFTKPRSGEEDILVLLYNDMEYSLDRSVPVEYDLTGNLLSDNGIPLSNYNYYIDTDLQLVITGIKDNDTSIKSAYIPAYFSPLSVRELVGTFRDYTELEEVTIENGIEDLVYTFSGCHKLKEVNIPETVIIMNGTFNNCYELEEVVLPSNIRRMENTFYNCRSLIEIDIPETVEMITNNVFYGCSLLETLTLPSELFRISQAYNIFGENSSLNTLNIYSSYIPNLDARDLPALETINLGGYEYNIKESQFENIPLKSINMDNATVYSIYENAFKGTQIENIALPASVNEVNPNAFFNCTSLKKIEVDGNNEYYLSEDGVLYNKDKTQVIIYPVGKEADTYIMPESVVEIVEETNGLFYGNRNLVNITISSNLFAILENTFAKCENLKSVTVNSTVAMGVTSRYDYFKDCKNVVSLYGYKDSNTEKYSQMENKNCVFIEIQ